MNTTISREKSAGDNEHIVIFKKENAKHNESYFSSPEREYINAALKDEAKQIVINQYKRIIVLQVIEKSADRNRLLESCRKAGDSLAHILNKRKITSAVLLDDNLNEELLAVAEGMALANYQFLKYKKDGKKEINTLKEIKLVSKRISDKEINLLNIQCEATCIARDLVNEPQSFLTATQLSKEFQNLGKERALR